MTWKSSSDFDYRPPSGENGPDPKNAPQEVTPEETSAAASEASAAASQLSDSEGSQEPEGSPDPKGLKNPEGLKDSEGSKDPFHGWSFSRPVSTPTEPVKPLYPSNAEDPPGMYTYYSDRGPASPEKPAEPSVPQYSAQVPQSYSRTQEPARAPFSQYEQYEQYEHAARYEEQVRPKKRRKYRGLAVFACVIGGIVACTLIFFSGYGLYSLISPIAEQQSAQSSATGENPISRIPDEPDSSESASSQASQSSSGGTDGLAVLPLEMQDKPVDENGDPAAVLSTVEIARIISPAVVGVEVYVATDAENPDELTLASSGSGIILTEDGFVVTNAHVIERAQSVKVVLHDGADYDAMIVGFDTITDIAVLKIEAEHLPHAVLGNSDQMEVGEFVMAFGNPGISTASGSIDLPGSVTYGMVSAVNRPIRTENSSLNCIQTDAAINPGNSGGALVNMYGQVIGINSAKIQITGYEGLGFAITINDARPIIEDLIQNGRVTGRIRLGITASVIDKMTAELYGLEPGLLIATIDDNPSFADAGIEKGDIITHINGESVSSFLEVSELINLYDPGETITVTVFRFVEGGENITFDAEISLILD